MDETCPATNPEKDQAPPAEQARVERRRRARDILSTQRSQLDRLEHELTDRLQHLAEEIAHDLALDQVATTGKDGEAVEVLQQQLADVREHLISRQAELEHAKVQLEHARVEAAKLEEELRIREALLTDAHSQHESRRSQLAAFQEQIADVQAQLAAAHERQEKLRAELAAEREELAEQQEKTNAQRRHIAREFKAQHAAHLKELERRKAELHSLATRTQAELEERLEAAEAAALEARGQRDDVRRTLDQRSLEWNQEGIKTQALETKVEELRESLQKIQADRDRLAAELARGGSMEHAELEAAQAAAEEMRGEVRKLEQELHMRESIVADAEKQQQERRLELAGSREQMAVAQAQLIAARDRQEELQRALEEQRAQAVAHEEKTKAQRRRIAREFKKEHAARVAELEQRKAELEALQNRKQTQLEADLAAAQSEATDARNRLTKLTGTLDEHSSELVVARNRALTLEAEVVALRQSLESAQAERVQLAGEIKHGTQDQTALEAARVAAEQAQLEASQLEQELRICKALVNDAQKQQEERRVELAASREQMALAQAQLTAARDQQQEMHRALAEQRAQAAELEEKTKAQRRHLARELKSQHADHLAELEKRKAELDMRQAHVESLANRKQVELAEQLAAAQAEAAEARERLAKWRESLTQKNSELEHDAQRTQALEAEAADLRKSLAKAEAERDRLAADVKSAGTSGSAASGELDKLRAERDSLLKRLAQAEANHDDEDDARKKEELQRRFEMAVEDLREMKKANAELESKLAKARGAEASGSGGGALDWEAQKQKLLASLEADDTDTEEAAEERLSIDATIRITDQIVAQKDLEIAELTRLLSERPGEVAAATANAVAVCEALNHDEAIQREREKLQDLQAEWRDKIGKAELDISVERAKLARERAELEEKLRMFQSEQASRAPEGEPGDAGKPVRGRWLSRLGLKDVDQQ